MKTGIELIAEERQEQIEKHGRTITKDVAYNNRGQLADGAIAMINKDSSEFPKEWDRKVTQKMVAKGYKHRLIIAGALIAAEIDRIQNL